MHRCGVGASAGWIRVRGWFRKRLCNGAGYIDVCCARRVRGKVSGRNLGVSLVAWGERLVFLKGFEMWRFCFVGGNCEKTQIEF